MKSIKKKIGISVIAVLLTMGLVAGLVLHNNVSTKAAGVDDNGETPITIDNKAPILDRIMENDGKLVILEIVPCEYASVMNMLFGSEKVLNKLEERAEKLYNTYGWVKEENGLTVTVSVGGNGSPTFGSHPFTITYNKVTKNYTVNYPNFFLEKFLDGYHNPQALSYFSKNTEIRTVVAGELTEEDLKDVSFVYISGTVEDKELIYFNQYIDGLIDEDGTKAPLQSTGAYDKDGNEYKAEQFGDIWYNCYIKDDNGKLISSDMQWDMVDKLVRYIYEGNKYTEGKPIPCIINYGNPKSTNCNVHKLTNILFKTSNETTSTYTNAGGTVNTYYLDVLKNITTYVGGLQEEETTEESSAESSAASTEAPTEKPMISLYLHNTMNWDKISVSFIDGEENEISSMDMAESELNPGWYELEIEYKEGTNIVFKYTDTESRSVSVSDVQEGKHWFELIELTGTGLYDVTPSDVSPENWVEKPVDPVNPVDPVDPVDPADPVDPVNPVEPEKQYYYNDYGLITGVYVYKDTEYLTWSDNSVPFFDMQCTTDQQGVDNQYVFNYIYKTSNNGQNSLFSIGRKNVPAIKDNGTAGLRGVGDTASKTYTATDILKYLFGVQDNNASIIRVLEIEPCQDFNYTYSSSDSADKKKQVVNNILALGSALRIKEYTNCDKSVSAYEALIKNNKKIEFKSMTVSQFNGMNENLMSSYDIIYIGDNSGMFNFTGELDSSNKYTGNPGQFYDNTGKNLLSSFYKDSSITFTKNIPIYNDKALDGYVYTAFGDLIKSETWGLGYLPDDYIEITIPKYDYNSSNHNQNVKIGGDSGWRLTSTSETTGLGKNSKYLFAIDTSVSTNKDLWTPLLYKTLSAKNNDGKAHFFVVKDVRNYIETVDEFDDPVGNMRFSANDLTKLKREEIEEFINYGNPVILADNVYNCTNDSLYNKQGGVVYPTSQVYSLVKKTSSSDSVIEEGRIYKNLISAFNENKLEITNCAVKYKKGAAWNDVPEIAYNKDLSIKQSSFIENPEKLKFIVDYTGTPGRTYKITLIYDKDTNGKYNDIATTDDSNEVMYSTKVVAKQKNNQVSFDIAIPTGYNGYYAWRVQITAIAGENEVDEDIFDGATPIKGEQKVVRALQIVPSINCNLNMGTADKFNKYMGIAENLINYDIEVDVITSDDYEKYYKDHPYTAKLDYDTDRNFLANGGTYDGVTYKGDYSMLIIGFADSFGFQDISDDYGALSNILDFESKGGSILLSHDTIGFSNNINFGIVSEKDKVNVSKLIKGCETNSSRYADKEAIDIVRKLRFIAGMDKYSVTVLDTLNDNLKLDDANIPKKIDGTYITEIQGYTNYWLQFYSMSRNDKTYASAYDGIYYYNYKDKDGNTATGNSQNRQSNVTLGTTKNALSYGLYSMSNIKTTKADEINKGQITSYPYNTTDADGKIKISETHGQYNALDLEDEDVVVWYTLSGDGNTRAKYYGDNIGDATNNYYIYSKGNITYSGAGHSSLNQDDELKLFVNTVIKAADAGNYVPEVEVLNGSRTKDKHNYVIYASSLDDKVKVEYVAKDDDLATRETVSTMYSGDEIEKHIGRFDSGKVYWLDARGDKHVLISYARGTTIELLNAERNNFYICDPNNYPNLNPGINKSVMSQCYQEYKTTGTVKIYFEATDSKGASGYSIATVLNHDLFDLD